MAAVPENRKKRRRWAALRTVAVVSVLVLALPALGFTLWPKLSWSAKTNGPLMHVVERGEFVHEITDRGEVESANSEEIRCEVKAKGAGGITIIEIVPNGAIIRKGDVLVKLDSSALEIERTNQEIVCRNSEANLIQAENVFKTAKIAKQEYLQGQFRQETETIQNEIFMVREDLSRAEEYYRYSQKLALRGYVTALQLKADRFAVEKAKSALKIGETKLEVLNKYTKEKMMIQLESDIKTAEAMLKAAKASHRLDTAQFEEINSQIEKCTIRAPHEGQVVYANESGWRGAREVIIAAGEQVREQQTIIRLPDSEAMQVLAKVNEAKISLVAPGMPATIRLDAFPDEQLYGVVEHVNDFPAPAGFFSSSVKEYETKIQIQGTLPGLRDGLTAEVRILIERIPDVLQVPVQAVFEHGGKFYCVMQNKKGDRWRARNVSLGSAHENFVVINKGLQEGDEVVLHAAAYRERVELPELPAGRGSDLSLRPAPDRPLPAGKALASAAQKRGPPVGGKAPPSGSPERDSRAMAQRLFPQFDKNNDGRLVQDELPEPMRPQFSTIDANGDGGIDRGEWMAAAAKFRPNRDEPAGNPPGPPGSRPGKIQ